MEGHVCLFLSHGRLTIVTGREFRVAVFLWNAMFQKQHTAVICDLQYLPADIQTKCKSRFWFRILKPLLAAPGLQGWSPMLKLSYRMLVQIYFAGRINLGIWFLYTLLLWALGFFLLTEIMNIQMSFRHICREGVTGLGEYFKAYDFYSFPCDMILVCDFKFYNKQT